MKSHGNPTKWGIVIWTPYLLALAFIPQIVPDDNMNESWYCWKYHMGQNHMDLALSVVWMIGSCLVAFYTEMICWMQCLTLFIYVEFSFDDVSVHLLEAHQHVLIVKPVRKPTHRSNWHGSSRQVVFLTKVINRVQHKDPVYEEGFPKEIRLADMNELADSVRVHVYACMRAWVCPSEEMDGWSVSEFPRPVFMPVVLTLWVITYIAIMFRVQYVHVKEMRGGMGAVGGSHYHMHIIGSTPESVSCCERWRQLSHAIK